MLLVRLRVDRLLLNRLRVNRLRVDRLLLDRLLVAGNAIHRATTDDRPWVTAALLATATLLATTLLATTLLTAALLAAALLAATLLTATLLATALRRRHGYGYGHRHRHGTTGGMFTVTEGAGGGVPGSAGASGGVPGSAGAAPTAGAGAGAGTVHTGAPPPLTGPFGACPASGGAATDGGAGATGDGGTALGAWGVTEPTLEFGTTTAGFSCFEPVPSKSIRPSPATIPTPATTAAANRAFVPRDRGSAVTVVGGKSSNFAGSDREPSSIEGSPNGLDAHASATVRSSCGMAANVADWKSSMMLMVCSLTVVSAPIGPPSQVGAATPDGSDTFFGTFFYNSTTDRARLEAMRGSGLGDAHPHAVADL